jgi:hypothetical protein
VRVALAVGLGDAVPVGDGVGVTLLGTLVLGLVGVATSVGLAVTLGVTVANAGDVVSLGVGTMLAIGLVDGLAGTLGVVVAVPLPVGVAETVMPGVGVGEAGDADGASVAVGGGQPRRAALTARTRSSTVTRPAPPSSAALQAPSGDCDSAIRTAVTSSSILTTPLPSQSPGHAHDDPGVTTRTNTPTNPNIHRIGDSLAQTSL